MAENAKKTEEQSEMQLQINQSTDELIQLATQDLLSNTIQSDREFQEMLETFQGFFIDGIDDMVSYKAVKDGAKKLKALRISIDKHRKSLTAPAVKWQKDLKKVADDYINQISPMEQDLMDKVKAIDDKKMAAEEALFSERAQQLAQAGFQLTQGVYMMGVLQVPAANLISLTAEELEFYLDEAEKEQIRVAARDKAYQDKIDALEKREQELADREAKIRSAELEDAERLANAQVEMPEQPFTAADEKFIIQEDADPEPTKEQPDPTEEQLEILTDEVESNDEVLADNFDEQFRSGYAQGFANMQMRMVEILSGEKKFKRPELLNWISSQEPNIN